MKQLQFIICMLFISLGSIAQQYPFLDLSGNPDTLRLRWDEEEFSLHFRSQSVLDEEQIMEPLNAIFRQQLSCDWLTVIAVEYDSPGSLTGQIIVQAAPNTTNSNRTSFFFSSLNASLYHIVQYPQGGLPEAHSVSGGGKIYPGRTRPIILSGSTVGVTYKLFQDSWNQKTVQGTGKPLIFDVEDPGTYTVKAVQNGTTALMPGSAIVEYYPVLNGKITIVETQGLPLPKDGGSCVILFTLPANYPVEGIQELEEIAVSCMTGESTSWNTSFHLSCYWISSTRGFLTVTRGPNYQDSPLECEFPIDVTTDNAAKISQEGGGELIEYEVTGGGEINPGQSATISLTGGQQMVSYSLYRNDTLVAKQQDTWAFPGQTVYGNYKIKAEYEGQETWMSGSTGVWPRIPLHTLSGGGTIHNGNPVTITLSGSQQGITYRLLRDGVVLSSFPGTGSAISFSIRDAGVYTIEGGLQDHYIPMNGNAVVSQNEGIYYTPTRGYQIERVYLDPTSTNGNARNVANITYLDGFGKKLQEIQIHASPGGSGDIIIPHEYGPFGNTEKEYLPYARNGNNATFYTNALQTTNWNIYGTTEANYAYNKITHDNSPLNRILTKTAPGKSWHTSNKAITTTYGTNSANEVLLYRVGNNGNLTCNEVYLPGTLRKETVTDEDHCTVETFHDKEDRIILIVSQNGNEKYETYSVYDKRGLLRYVLSPEASLKVKNAINESNLQQLAYYYEYDHLKRLIIKRLPGCAPVYMVYDKLNRLVMSQDGKQRSENANKWSYSLYDHQNREIETGEVISTVTSHTTLRTAASASGSYTPSGSRIPLQYTLYDTYTATSNVPVLSFQSTTGYSSEYNQLVTGLVTSVKTKLLETGTEKWLTTTTYYDDRYRAIQSVCDNLHGRLSRIDIKYDFTGNIVQQRESHGITASQTDVLESVNSFDNRGRLLQTTIKLNNSTPATIHYTYDAVGRLIKKKFGNVEETSTYNTRGWLTSRESTPFKMKLRYEQPESSNTIARWNGNISEWEWKHGTTATHMYTFTYDGVNRLTGTSQMQKNGTAWDSLTANYLEKGITYDRNGNIKTLQRTSSGTLVDNLRYTYTGNRLTNLAENVRTSPAGDIYLPGSSTSGAYTYDLNGNMINDSRRALSLSYNLLNLLSEVKTGSTLKAKYSYLADGTKLRVRDGSNNGFDYLGSLTYKKSSAGLQLESANFSSGVIRTNTSNNGGTEINYFLTDHLGSVRVIIDGNGVVQERNDYYPFGAKHIRSDYSQQNNNRYKYNGKEEQVTGSLNYLDYGARMYDSGLGRWFGIDPKAEKFYHISPYCYVFNNPLLWIDPNGELPAVAIPIGGIVVMISAMDMILIGTGLVSSTVTLRRALDRHNISITDEIAEFWARKLDALGAIYAEYDEYVKRERQSAQNPDYEWQRRKDREIEDAYHQRLADMLNSINTNYEGPSPDGSSSPKGDIKPKAKIILVTVLTIIAMHNCDMTSTPGSTPQTEVFGNFVKGILGYFFEIKEEKEEKKK